MNDFGVSRGPQVKLRHRFCSLSSFCHNRCFLTSDVFAFTQQGPPGLPGLKGSKVRLTGVSEEITIQIYVFSLARQAMGKSKRIHASACLVPISLCFVLSFSQGDDGTDGVAGKPGLKVS